jgi:hypothetical protein
MEDYHDEPYENDLRNAQIKEAEQERINEQVKPSLEDYRKQIKDDKCSCGYVGLSKLRIEHYDHDGGWPVEGFKEKQWLYVTCPKCGYQWALWKLGVPR